MIEKYELSGNRNKLIKFDTIILQHIDCSQCKANNQEVIIRDYHLPEYQSLNSYNAILIECPNCKSDIAITFKLNLELNFKSDNRSNSMIY